MAYLIVALSLAAVYFGFSPVPVFVIGTGALVLVAYWMSRSRTLLRLGLSFAGFAVMHFVLVQFAASGFLSDADELERLVFEIGASDKVMIAIGSVVMLIALMIGIFGTFKRDSVEEFVKHEGRSEGLKKD